MGDFSEDYNRGYQDGLKWARGVFSRLPVEDLYCIIRAHNTGNAKLVEKTLLEILPLEENMEEEEDI